MADGPLWMRALLRAERAVGEPLARAANSREAAGVLLAVARGGQVGRTVAARVRGAAVHALNLPSQRDVERLDAKIERLQRSLDDLAADDGTPGEPTRGRPA